MSRPAIDMAGKKFGKWTVLGRCRARGPALHWRCLCECGRVASVAGKHLRAGSSRGCGPCRRREVPTEERICRWCRRHTSVVRSSKPKECGACERRAHRNGRAADGRPLYRDPTGKSGRPRVPVGP